MSAVRINQGAATCGIDLGRYPHFNEPIYCGVISRMNVARGAARTTPTRTLEQQQLMPTRDSWWAIYFCLPSGSIAWTARNR